MRNHGFAVHVRPAPGHATQLLADPCKASFEDDQIVKPAVPAAGHGIDTMADLLVAASYYSATEQGDREQRFSRRLLARFRCRMGPLLYFRLAAEPAPDAKEVE